MKKNNQSKKDSQKLEGFGGWLALFAFKIYITPIVILGSIVWPGEHNSLEIFLNILIIIAYIWLNYLMTKRKRTYKKWFLGIGIIMIIIFWSIALIANGSSSLYTQSQLHHINTVAFWELFNVIVWSLYLWNSKRVKNTFIN